MLIGDWLTLIGEALLIVGVTGWTLHETSRGPRKGDVARSDHGSRASITGEIWGLLRRRPPDGGRAAGLRATADGPRVDRPETDGVCRLADGSMGRVAIILGTDAEWTTVCVPA